MIIPKAFAAGNHLSALLRRNALGRVRISGPVRCRGMGPGRSPFVAQPDGQADHAGPSIFRIIQDRSSKYVSSGVRGGII